MKAKKLKKVLIALDYDPTHKKWQKLVFLQIISGTSAM